MRRRLPGFSAVPIGPLCSSWPWRAELCPLAVPRRPRGRNTDPRGGRLSRDFKASDHAAWEKENTANVEVRHWSHRLAKTAARALGRSAPVGRPWENLDDWWVLAPTPRAVSPPNEKGGPMPSSNRLVLSGNRISCPGTAWRYAGHGHRRRGLGRQAAFTGSDRHAPVQLVDFDVVDMTNRTTQGYSRRLGRPKVVATVAAIRHSIRPFRGGRRGPLSSTDGDRGGGLLLQWIRSKPARPFGDRRGRCCFWADGRMLVKFFGFWSSRTTGAGNITPPRCLPNPRPKPVDAPPAVPFTRPVSRQG